MTKVAILSFFIIIYILKYIAKPLRIKNEKITVKNTLRTFTLAALSTLFITPAFAADITVATAAGYRKPMNEIYTAFTKPIGFSENHQKLGQGKLILIAPKGSTLTNIDDLTAESMQRIAIGDRKSTIYGKAAIEFLASDSTKEILKRHGLN